MRIIFTYITLLAFLGQSYAAEKQFNPYRTIKPINAENRDRRFILKELNSLKEKYTVDTTKSHSKTEPKSELESED